MRSRVVGVCSFGLGVMVALVALAGNAMAIDVPAIAPEIDPNTILTGLGLLAAGVLLVRSRRRSK